MLPVKSRELIVVHLRIILQVGNAITLDGNQYQMVDLGDVSGYSCFSRPETCGPDGASLTAWINILDCPMGSGFIGSVNAIEQTGFRVFCHAGGIKWVILYFILRYDSSV